MTSKTETSPVPKHKFLMIVPSYACTLTNGAGQRTSLLYRSLQQMGGIDVVVIGYGGAQYLSEIRPTLDSFFPNADAIHLTESPHARGELGFWRFLRPFHPRLVDLLAKTLGRRSVVYQPDQRIAPFVEALQNANHYDFVVCRYLRPTAPSGVFHSSRVPVLLDIDDRDVVVYQSRIKRPGLNPILRLLLKWHLRQIREVVVDLKARCKHIWVASESDQQEIKHPSISVLPNIPYTLDFQINYIPCPVNNISKTVLFVGSHTHRVNREGVDHFVLNCWPMINATVKDATFRIIGSGGWSEFQERFKHIKNVEVIGFTENLEEEYKRAAFTVVPLFEGGGTKIKVLETLFYQRTAVVTTHAHSGYEILRHGESLIVADSEAELANGCITLLTNSDLRSSLAEHGRTQVIANYSFDRFFSEVRATIEKYSKKQNSLHKISC